MSWLWLRPELSHLHHHKFKHNIQDTLNTIFRCSNNIETTIYLLHFSNYYSNANTSKKVKVYFGKSSLNVEENTSLLNADIEFISATKRFDDGLI